MINFLTEASNKSSKIFEIKPLSNKTIVVISILVSVIFAALCVNAFIYPPINWNFFTISTLSFFILFVILTCKIRRSENQVLRQTYLQVSSPIEPSIISNKMETLGIEVNHCIFRYLQYDEIVLLRRTCRYFSRDIFYTEAAISLGFNPTHRTDSVQPYQDFERIFLKNISDLSAYIDTPEFYNLRKYKNVRREVISWRYRTTSQIINIILHFSESWLLLKPMARYLLRAGMIKGELPQSEAMEAVHQLIVNIILKDSIENPEGIQIIELLHFHGADFNQPALTEEPYFGLIRPLEICVLKKSVIYCAFLLQKGALVSKCAGFRGVPPLVIASFQGSEDIVKILLTAGAAVDQVASNGATSLIMAMTGGHQRVIKLLLEAKANPNGIHDSNTPPLHWAVIKNRENIVKMLLDAKADIDALDVRNRTPYACATQERMQRILIQAGAHSEMPT